MKICEGETFLLKSSTDLMNLHWNTNETSQSIIISIPGYYWLKATNNEGCISSDTMKLSFKEDCIRAIYFPTAITPNKDGKNDVFRPKAFAPLNTYHLSIYNRFGEKIFETNEANTGWDGFVKGSAQNIDTFIYFCRYRFVGTSQAEQIQKGTFVVIR